MVPRDIVENYKGNIIQHGLYNDRIYLIKLASEVPRTFPGELIEVAEKKGYSKIFAKVPECQADVFSTAGFKEEARIPGFYDGKTAAVFTVFYLNDKRAKESEISRLEEILRIALDKNVDYSPRQPADELSLRICNEADVGAMADIYRTVFPSYPFPIHDSDYIKETMNSHVDYFGIETNGQLVAISSAEMDKQSSNVEMTDFATLSEYRGNGFAQLLLSRMEYEMKANGLKTAYTIARAMSVGMNVTFKKSGYQFGGRLKNNTNISGQIESMNVWYKRIG